MAGPQQSGFDVDAARQAGYSDDEILGHLTQTRNFDVSGALSSGYSKADIIDHLSSTRGQDLVNMPGAPSQQPAMQTSALGALAPQSVPQTRGAGSTQDVPGFEGMYASNDQDSAKFMTGAGLTGGALLGATAATPGVLAAGAAAAARHPVLAKIVTNLTKEAVKGTAIGAGYGLYRRLTK